MESENQVGQINQPGVDTEAQTSEGRRKLIRGALVGAPILLALKSTPVLAINCKLPSGFSTSGNLSRNAGATCTEPAAGPVYWRTAISGSEFTGTGVSKNAAFNSIFSPSSDSTKLINILDTGSINFSTLVIAAYLDAKASAFLPGVSALNVQQMWAGTYVPTGSVSPWTLAESENYLRYVMGQPLNP